MHRRTKRNKNQIMLSTIPIMLNKNGKENLRDVIRYCLLSHSSDLSTQIGCVVMTDQELFIFILRKSKRYFKFSSTISIKLSKELQLQMDRYYSYFHELKH